MDQYLNTRQKEILLRLLANPADTGGAYLSNLQELVKLYPQAGLFRALYGRALNEATPLVAGAYFDSRALHKLLFHHDNIAPISNEQVVIQSDGKLFGGTFTETAAAPDFVSEAQIAEVDQTVDSILSNQATDFPEVSTDEKNAEPSPAAIEPEPIAEPLADFAEPVEIPLEETLPEYTHEDVEAADEATTPPFAPAPWEIAQAEATTEPLVDDEPLGRAPWELDEDDEDENPVAAPPAEAAYFEPVVAEPGATVWEHQEPAIEHQVDDELASKLAYWASLEDEYDAPPVQAPVQEEPTPAYYHQESAINDDVYNEITSIDDIGLEQLNVASAEVEEQQAVQDEADRLIMGNIAATDFFTFDKAFGDSTARTVPEPQQQAAPESAPPPMYRPHPQSAPPSVREQPAPQHNEVSKYHDEKMPYSFMWWLDKTRQEHGSLYQPYVKAPMHRTVSEPAHKPRPDELQQQYFENIFHLSSVEDFVPDAAKTIEFDMQSKEDRIIQRFITVDPHIHPPVGDKLDTENKAKKSSEDAYEMVTETLARIYADQMLFPKAIATYKKLMLKYPEKSRYFASRIENLEKRTN